MGTRFLKVSIFILVMGTASCSNDLKEQDSTTTSTDDSKCIESGDIIVSNSGSDAVISLDSEGNFKKVIYNLLNGTENPYGVAWSSVTDEVLVVVDGSDRVMAISADDCSSRIFVADTNLTGNLRGITQLDSGDVLIIETNNIERFSSDGYRVSASWPKALQTTGSDIFKTSGDGFAHCSTGTDVLRTYDSTGTQLATTSSGIAATTDAAGCAKLSNGNFAVAWSGTTDTVVIYDSTLSTVIGSYSNLSVLSTPGGITQDNDGNLLVIDRVLNQIVKLDATGNYIGIIGDGFLSTPEYIMVVP